MAMSEADKKACKKYQATLKAFTIRLKPEELNRYKAAAEKAGMTFRGFVISSLDKASS
jgi:predicted DNA binding CopG/RHH family protein